MDLSRERLIGRHNRTPQTSICRSLVGFAIMITVTCTLLIVGLVLTGQAKTAAQILSSHKRCEQSEMVIIAHRGASGMMPAHSVPGYELAADQGADYIECDAALTKDGMLVCLHDAFLSPVTDIEEHDEFADRKRVLEYEGVEHDDWWVVDFTWDELQTLRLIQERPYRDQQFNGQFEIATFDAYLNVAKSKHVGIYPETKTPAFFAKHVPDFKMEDLMISQIDSSGIDADQITLQSFDPSSLLYMKTKLQVDYRLVQLTKRSLSDDELAKLVEAGAYGVGSDKRLIIESDEANHRHGVSDFVSRIHRHGLMVHIWTSRNENQFLLFDYGADVHEEYKDLVKAGVDGVFTDFTHSLFNFLALQQDTCN